MDTDDVTIALTRTEFDNLRRMVGRAERAYSSDAQTWHEVSRREVGRNTELSDHAERNANVCLDEHAVAVLIGQQLTEAYVKVVAPELV